VVMRKFILFLLLACCGAWASNSASRTVPRAQQNSTRASDAEIEQTIRTKLAKSKIGKDGFQVHVKGGIATWEGHTGVLQHKGAATRMAKSAGAVRVVNNIAVTGNRRPGESPRHATVKSD